MFQNLRSRLRDNATAAADFSETKLPFGRGIAGGLLVNPTRLNRRSPLTGRHYRAATQFRVATPGRIDSEAYLFTGVIA